MKSGRRPPVIDLTAAEIPAEQTASTAMPEPPIPDSPEALTESIAEASAAPEPLVVPPMPPARPSMVIPLVLAAALGAVFGGVGGTLVPSFFGSGTARLSGLEKTQQQLAQSQLARDQAGLASAAELNAAKQALTRLEADVAKRLADTTAALNQKFTSLEGNVASLAARPAGSAAGTGGGTVTIPDIAPLQQRLAALEAQLKAIDAQAAGPQIATLSNRVDQAVKRFEAGQSAPLFAAAQALSQAFHRGTPFAVELAAVETLGAKSEQLISLKPFAEKGAPTLQRLAEGFAPLATKLATNPEESGGLLGFTQRFIKLRPSGEATGNTPAALVASIEAALNRGDLPLAMSAWGRLPEPARMASATWAAQASDRDKAAKSLAALQETAVSALRKSTP